MGISSIVRTRVVALPFLGAGPAPADTVVLRNGAWLVGQVVNETDGTVVLQVDSGTVWVPQHSVASISCNDSMVASSKRGRTVTYGSILGEIQNATDARLPPAERIKNWLWAQIRSGVMQVQIEDRDFLDPVMLYQHKKLDCNEFAHFVAKMYAYWTGQDSLTFGFQFDNRVGHEVAVIQGIIYDILDQGSAGKPISDWLRSPWLKSPVAVSEMCEYRWAEGRFRETTILPMTCTRDERGFYVAIDAAEGRKRIRDRFNESFGDLFDRYFSFQYTPDPPSAKTVRCDVVIQVDGCIAPQKWVYGMSEALLFTRRVVPDDVRRVGWTVYAPDGSVYWQVPDEYYAERVCEVPDGRSFRLGEPRWLRQFGFEYPAFVFTERTPAGTFTAEFVVQDDTDCLSVYRTTFEFRK